MSRVTTPMAQPTSTMKVPHEKIAMRAYEKWLKRGCTHGHDQQDWMEAEAELRVEMSRTGQSTGHMSTPQPAPAHATTRR